LGEHKLSATELNWTQNCLHTATSNATDATQRGSRGQGMIPPPKKKIGLWENCRKVFVRKMLSLGPTTPIFGKLKGKIEIVGTHNLFCRKFAAVCRKTATSCPAYF